MSSTNRSTYTLPLVRVEGQDVHYTVDGVERWSTLAEIDRAATAHADPEVRAALATLARTARELIAAREERGERLRRLQASEAQARQDAAADMHVARYGVSWVVAGPHRHRAGWGGTCSVLTPSSGCGLARADYEASHQGLDQAASWETRAGAEQALATWRSCCLAHADELARQLALLELDPSSVRAHRGARS